MTVQEVENEIQTVFKQPMNSDQNFPYLYLQPTGCGSHSLTVPSLSPSFEWTVQQVAKLGANKGIIYIIAQDFLSTHFESESEESDNVESYDVSSKDDNVANKDNDGKEVKPSTVTPAPLNDSCAELSYRSYVDVIDLTGEVLLQESMDSDLDELPEVPISMTPRTARSTCMDLPEVFQAKHAMLQHQQRVITGKMKRIRSEFTCDESYSLLML